jgi:hypothetical protein
LVNLLEKRDRLKEIELVNMENLDLKMMWDDGR